MAHRGVVVPSPTHNRHSMSLCSVTEADDGSEGGSEGLAGTESADASSSRMACKLAQAQSLHSGFASRHGSTRPNSDSKSAPAAESSPANSEPLAHTRVRIVVPGMPDIGDVTPPPAAHHSGSLPRLAAAPYPAPPGPTSAPSPAPSPAPAEITTPRASLSPQRSPLPSPRPALRPAQPYFAASDPAVSAAPGPAPGRASGTQHIGTSAVQLEMVPPSALRRASLENSGGGAPPPAGGLRHGGSDGGAGSGALTKRIKPSVRCCLLMQIWSRAAVCCASLLSRVSVGAHYTCWLCVNVWGVKCCAAIGVSCLCSCCFCRRRPPPPPSATKWTLNACNMTGSAVSKLS